MSSVQFQKVSKSYDGINNVVDGVDLHIEDGAFVSFLGPSGCGKTTCLRMVAGLEKNTGGKIALDDKCVAEPSSKIFLPPEKREIGMVFQSYAVWPHMNVFNNIAYPLKIKKMSKSDIKAKVQEVMDVVELSGYEERMPNALSGGQQQRVALARGLVAQPKVLLLDEPLSNLDAKLREKMRVDIRKIQQQFKITCIYVTHDQIEAFSMSDKIAVMKQGKILQYDSPDMIRSNPADDFVKDFIS
jgi:iron(III) transport system ATP-binding protein